MQKALSSRDYARVLVTDTSTDRLNWHASVLQEVRQYSSHHGFSLKMAPVSALLAAYGLPIHSPSAVLIAQLTYWLFLVDASFDETLKDASHEDVHHHRDILVSNHPKPRAHQQTISWRLRAAYEDLPLPSRNRDQAHRATDALVNGMVQEAVWSRQFREQQPLPTFTEYMVNGAKTSGMHVLAAAISSPQEWNMYASLIQDTAYLMRVSNELATYAKEQAEGKLTVINLMQRSMQLTTVQAERFLIDTMESLASTIFACQETSALVPFLQKATAMGIIMASHGGYAALEPLAQRMQ